MDRRRMMMAAGGSKRILWLNLYQNGNYTDDYMNPVYRIGTFITTDGEKLEQDIVVEVDFKYYNTKWGSETVTLEKGITGKQITFTYQNFGYIGYNPRVISAPNNYEVKFKPQNHIYFDGKYIRSTYPVEKNLSISYEVYVDGIFQYGSNIIFYKGQSSSSEFLAFGDIVVVINDLSYSYGADLQYSYTISYV